MIYTCAEGDFDEEKAKRFCRFWLRFRLKRMLVLQGHTHINADSKSDLKGETAESMFQCELFVQLNADRFMINEPTKLYNCVVCRRQIFGHRWCHSCWKYRKVEEVEIKNTMRGIPIAEVIFDEWQEK